MNDALALGFLGHMVGDFLLQNDWMAQNKKKDYWICAIHSMIWALTVCFFIGRVEFWFINFLYLSHYVIDSTNLVPCYMRLVGQKDFMIGPCAPWSIIVVDNTFHLLTIWIAWRFL